MFRFWAGNDRYDDDVYLEANDIINVQEFKGTPGQALLWIAANRHLSGRKLMFLLIANRIERSPNWIQRRRWLFSDPDKPKRSGGRGDADGKDERAYAVLRKNTALSLRNMVKLLKDHGIKRSVEWVRRHRLG